MNYMTRPISTQDHQDTFANSLNPDQDRQNISSDLDLNHLTADTVPERIVNFEELLGFYEKIGLGKQKIWTQNCAFLSYPSD